MIGPKLNGVIWGPKLKKLKYKVVQPKEIIPEELEVFAVQVSEDNTIISEVVSEEPKVEEELFVEEEDKPKRKSRRKDLEQFVDSTEQ